MADWISVDARLPAMEKVNSVCLAEEESPMASGRLLVFDEDEGEQFVAEYLIPVDGSEAFWTEIGSGCTLRGVTHWTTLPSDPVAAEQERA